MAASHYAYNLLKIHGPNIVITIHDDFDMALKCEDNNAKLADAVIVEETVNASKLVKYFDLVNPDDPILLKKPHIKNTLKTTFKSVVLTRQVDLVLGDSSQQVTVSAWLNSA
jgi:hypothetical protein